MILPKKMQMRLSGSLSLSQGGELMTLTSFRVLGLVTFKKRQLKELGYVINNTNRSRHENLPQKSNCRSILLCPQVFEQFRQKNGLWRLQQSSCGKCPFICALRPLRLTIESESEYKSEREQKREICGCCWGIVILVVGGGGQYKNRMHTHTH